MNKADIENIDKNFTVHAQATDGFCMFDCLCEPFSVFGLIAPEDDNGAFLRIPESVALQCNEGVVQLNSHTAGGRVTFATDSDVILIKALQHRLSKMSHMALTGSVGFDLYEKKDGKYTYRGTFIPPFDSQDGFEASVSVGKGGMREYTVNFPLYSGVKQLYIGLKDASTLSKASPYRLDIPIVYYGSSITQGGCASRPGNSYQAIISREFDCDYINLGFSGSAKGEKAIAEYIADIKMSVFVCDYDHNAPTAEHLRSTLSPFISAVRDKQPETPIIMLSRPQINPNTDELLRRDIVKDAYQMRKNGGDSNIFFIDGTVIMKSFAGDSGTVDGCHPNDAGFLCMAQAISDVLKRIFDR